MATRNKIRLSEIVNDYMIGREQEDYDAHVLKQKVMLRAKQGLKMLSRRTGSGGIKSLSLPVSNFMVTLPPDFMDYIKIGFVDGNGDIISFGRNERFSMGFEVLTDNLGNPLLDVNGYYLEGKNQTTQNNTSLWFDGGAWINLNGDEGVFTSYGMPPVLNQYGTYRIDYENEFIEFSTNMGFSSVVLEYISDPTMNPDPLVDQRLEQAIVAYIYWKNIERMANVPDNHRMYAKNEFYNEQRKAHDRINNFTLTEALKYLKMGVRPVKF